MQNKNFEKLNCRPWFKLTLANFLYQSHNHKTQFETQLIMNNSLIKEGIPAW